MNRLFTIGAMVLCGHIAGMSSAQAGANVQAEIDPYDPRRIDNTPETN